MSKADASSRIQLALTFGYDGARFHGVEPQRGLATALDTLRTRLEAAAGQRARALCVSARTDSGVHALANRATCWFKAPLEVPNFARTLRTASADGLLHVSAEQVPIHVHARGSSRGKRYRYLVDSECPRPLVSSPYAWRFTESLDAAAMRKAGEHFCGTLDFSSLRAKSCSASSPVKTIQSIRLGGPFPLADGSVRWIIEVTGTAFLKRMVRVLVGTLVEVGTGLRPPDSIPELLASKTRHLAGKTAPAHGLALMQVGFAYPEDDSARVWELRELDEAPERLLAEKQAQAKATAASTEGSVH